ncbi:hypothetical protein [Vulcanisaeta thermophila]|uniref:hypothetical protein n=1 Tax=Vulcanisaeta thermophila TaxID=867917 RepID=UPI000853E830|nr:hypothetical protein [Vulcanisaeta thermophila]
MTVTCYDGTGKQINCTPEELCKYPTPGGHTYILKTTNNKIILYRITKIVTNCTLELIAYIDEENGKYEINNQAQINDQIMKEILKTIIGPEALQQAQTKTTTKEEKPRPRARTKKPEAKTEEKPTEKKPEEKQQ